MDRGVIVEEIEASGLRGRGGAAFPTGVKWRTVVTARDEPKYVVCNADEGDPGAYSDRFLLEDDPHTILEGMAIAAAAVGATQGYVYVRKEYPEAQEALERAIAETRTAGIFGERLLGRGPAFDVEIVRGEGSYVCGEETALLNAIEGRRPEVRARPPYPAEHGLNGCPTLVHNVETLAALPWILRHGAAAYEAMGRGTSRGTKVVSLNSLFVRPGLYEVEFGMPVAEIVHGLGGGLATGELRGVLIGGPLAGILPVNLLDTPFTIDALREVGADVGHGGVVAFDEHTSITELVHHVFRFGAFESCGKCTPCRVGAGRIEDLFGDALSADRVPVGASAEWRDIVDALAATSLCGHGTGLAAFARSALEHYGEELIACLG
jgi:formate dehydrogenase iron-sulfur subunit